MVTIMVGKANPGSSKADIYTLCDGADEPRRVKFDLCDLKPGKPA